MRLARHGHGLREALLLRRLPAGRSAVRVSFPVSRLREIREERGVSQAALARHIGVGRRSVVRWESGESSPSPLALGALAAFFGEVEKASSKRKAQR